MQIGMTMTSDCKEQPHCTMPVTPYAHDRQLVEQGCSSRVAAEGTPCVLAVGCQSAPDLSQQAHAMSAISDGYPVQDTCRRQKHSKQCELVQKLTLTMHLFATSHAVKHNQRQAAMPCTSLHGSTSVLGCALWDSQIIHNHCQTCAITLVAMEI